MISSWFSNKKQQKPPSLTSPSKQLDTLLTLVTNHLTLLISRQLGEHVPVPPDIVSSLKQQLQSTIKQQTSDATKLLETNLVSVKQRYNHIVSSLQQTKLGIREFHTGLGNSIEGFVGVLSESLQSRQLMVVMKDLRKAIMESSGQGVEKYFNLLGRLYQHEYEKGKESSREMESQAKANKSLQSQIVLLRQQKKLTEKKVQQLEQDRVNAIKSLNLKQQSLLSKLKSSEQSFAQALLDLKESNKKVQALQIQNTLVIQEQESTRLNSESKEQRYLLSIKKLSQEKMEIEDKYSESQIQIKRMKGEQEVVVAKETEGLAEELEKMKGKVGVLEGDVERLRKQIEEKEERKGEYVEKGVVRGMLEVYMDEGKEWRIRNQVEKQLGLLLGMGATKEGQQEKANVEEGKQQEKKGWFGWF